MNKQEIDLYIAEKYKPTCCAEERISQVDDILTVLYLSETKVHDDVIIEFSKLRKRLEAVVNGCEGDCTD